MRINDQNLLRAFLGPPPHDFNLKDLFATVSCLWSHMTAGDQLLSVLQPRVGHAPQSLEQAGALPRPQPPDELDQVVGVRVGHALIDVHTNLEINRFID